MIFFDLDGTLLDHKGSEYLAVKMFYSEFKNIFTIEEEVFYSLWCKISDKHFQRYLNGELTFRQQQRERIKELFLRQGINLSDEEAGQKFQIYLQNYEKSWETFDDIIPCLKQFQGYRLGIISNGDFEQQVLKLERIGIRHYFEVIVTAGDTGVAKPNTKIFEIACERAKEVPSCCVYIGDDLEMDILPCQKIGMDGIWLNRKGEPLNTSGIKMICSLENLKDCL